MSASHTLYELAQQRERLEQEILDNWRGVLAPLNLDVHDVGTSPGEPGEVVLYCRWRIPAQESPLVQPLSEVIVPTPLPPTVPEADSTSPMSDLQALEDAFRDNGLDRIHEMIASEEPVRAPEPFHAPAPTPHADPPRARAPMQAANPFAFPVPEMPGQAPENVRFPIYEGTAAPGVREPAPSSTSHTPQPEQAEAQLQPLPSFDLTAAPVRLPIPEPHMAGGHRPPMPTPAPTPRNPDETVRSADVFSMVDEQRDVLRVTPVHAVRTPNPFMHRTESAETRAERTARALISDIVFYDKAGHQAAVAAGPAALQERFGPVLDKAWRMFVNTLQETKIMELLPPDSLQRIYAEQVNEILGLGQVILAVS